MSTARAKDRVWVFLPGKGTRSRSKENSAFILCPNTAGTKQLPTLFGRRDGTNSCQSTGSVLLPWVNLSSELLGLELKDTCLPRTCLSACAAWQPPHITPLSPHCDCSPCVITPILQGRRASAEGLSDLLKYLWEAKQDKPDHRRLVLLPIGIYFPGSCRAVDGFGSSSALTRSAPVMPLLPQTALLPCLLDSSHSFPDLECHFPFHSATLNTLTHPSGPNQQTSSCPFQCSSVSAHSILQSLPNPSLHHCLYDSSIVLVSSVPFHQPHYLHKGRDCDIDTPSTHRVALRMVPRHKATLTHFCLASLSAAF